MPVKKYIYYIITLIVFISQLGYFLSMLTVLLIYVLPIYVLILTLCTNDIMIFGGMNRKLASKNIFWKWISRREGENNEMGIPNSRELSQLNWIESIAFVFESIIEIWYYCWISSVPDTKCFKVHSMLNSMSNWSTFDAKQYLSSLITWPIN